MVSGTDEKRLKVAWICHFTDKEVQDILKPWKRIREMAPWIPSLAKVLENQEAIELHIVSPHEYLSGYKQFTLRGVHYHFFNAHIPFWGRHWPGFFKFDYWSDFTYNKFKVKRIIRKINPDILHLQGAENAYYSSTIFQFKDKYPILVTLQGFLHKLADKNSSMQVRRRIECELKIYNTFQHFGIRTETMGKVVQSINSNAVPHWHGYGIKIALPEKKITTEKKYDLVFFARISQSKGIEDLLRAVSLLKNQKEDISLLVMGSVSSDYLAKLKELCRTLGIENNITWAGFLPTQADVHEAVSEAKITVLPAHYDMIPGTIIESMLLKIPVVAYNVGSIHELNNKEEVISLVNKDDIAGLAEAIMLLLKDEKLYEERAEKGYKRVVEMLDNSNVFADLLKAYREVIADFINPHI
jgi:glycosyltransferase involved in cell wall biosynthesis